MKQSYCVKIECPHATYMLPNMASLEENSVCSLDVLILMGVNDFDDEIRYDMKHNAIISHKPGSHIHDAYWFEDARNLVPFLKYYIVDNKIIKIVSKK